MNDAYLPLLPDPGTVAVASWLQTMDRHDIHGDGWVRMNQRFHGITVAMRPYITQHFTTADEQRAAFDGLTLALMTLSRFSDIGHLAHLLDETSSLPEKFLPPPVG